MGPLLRRYSNLTSSCLFTEHTRFDSHFLDGGLDVEEQQNCLRDLTIVIHVIYFCGVGQHLTLLLVKTENIGWTDFKILSGCSSWLRNEKWVAWVLQAAGACENACGLAMKSDEWYCLDFKIAAVFCVRLYFDRAVIVWVATSVHPEAFVEGADDVPMVGSNLSLLVVKIHLPRVVSVVCWIEARCWCRHYQCDGQVSEQVKLFYLPIHCLYLRRSWMEAGLISFLSCCVCMFSTKI
jgi:hypothetical protein